MTSWGKSRPFIAAMTVPSAAGVAVEAASLELVEADGAEEAGRDGVGLAAGAALEVTVGAGVESGVVGVGPVVVSPEEPQAARGRARAETARKVVNLGVRMCISI